MNTRNHPRIETVRTSSLKPNPRNARTHSKKQISQIAASIKQYGWLSTIIVDDTGMIVAGHGRWLAAKKLNLREVPIIRAKFVSDEDRRAFALADNKIAELAGWDEDLVAEELSELFEGGYEIELTGFGSADLDFALINHDEDGDDEPAAGPPPAEPVSSLGDLWLIGPHRIYCGDASDSVSWDALLGSDRAHMIFADPPYNVPIDGFVSGNGKNTHHEFVMAAGEMSPAEFTAFLRALFRNCVQYSVNGSIHYHCMDWRHMRELLDAADGVYSEHKQLVVWDKGTGGQGGFYRSQHELVFVFKSGKAKHTNNFGLGETGRYRTNIVQYAGANSFRNGRDEDLAALTDVAAEWRDIRCNMATYVAEKETSERIHAGFVVFDHFIRLRLGRIDAEGPAAGNECAATFPHPENARLEDPFVQQWMDALIGQIEMEASDPYDWREVFLLIDHIWSFQSGDGPYQYALDRGAAEAKVFSKGNEP